MAPRDVRPGAQYADAIVRAINEAKGMVLVLSGSAVASDHVAREVERAASKRKPIFAFRIDSAALNPGQFGSERTLAQRLSRLQQQAVQGGL
jgi:succinyl-CoA synthetase alpha subunit